MLISDDAKPLITAKKWLECLKKNEDASSYLEENIDDIDPTNRSAEMGQKMGVVFLFI